MKLELVINENVFIYPLNKERIFIGASQNSDIVINAESISRRHVQLLCTEDEVYIIDQGSMNGTFINEERLVPGKRYELTTFFPVYLGTSVVLNLLSESVESDGVLAEFNLSSNLEKQELSSPTLLMSDSSLSEFVTKKIDVKNIKKTRPQVDKRKTDKKKSTADSSMNYILMFCCLVLGWALHRHYYGTSDSESAKVTLATIGANSDQALASRSLSGHQLNYELMDPSLIPSKDRALNVFKDFKCISETEKNICDALSFQLPFGATQIGRDIFIFSPLELEQNYQASLESKLGTNFDEIPLSIFIAQFLLNSNPILGADYNDFRIHVYFLNDQEEIFGGFSYYPPAFRSFKKKAPVELMDEVLVAGFYVLEFMDEYITTHQ